jgi:hypothetical protein
MLPESAGFKDENDFVHLETATALKRGIRVIPGLARLAYSRRSAIIRSATADFGEAARGGVLSRTIEFGNDGEGVLTVSSDERLGGTGQKTSNSPRRSRNSQADPSPKCGRVMPDRLPSRTHEAFCHDQPRRVRPSNPSMKLFVAQ